MKKITTPLNSDAIAKLKAGDEVLLSGTVYTARDQAHKRLLEMIKKGKKLPFDIRAQIIYYTGPTETPRNKIIGSCGPTTAGRMDSFAPILYSKGLAATIGKGRRSPDVRRAIRRYKKLYLLAPAGLGALLAQKVVRARTIAFGDLGPEAIRCLEVRDFPLIVAIDSKGKDIYGKR